MGELLGGLKNFGQMLLRNKGKIALIPLLAIAWVPFLFPYSDLRAVVATTLSHDMGEGTAIDFDHIALATGFPVALQLENFEFNAPGLPPITADRLVAKPSLSSIFTHAPAGTIIAEGLFKGDVTASLSSGAKLKSGGHRQDIKADLSGIQLAVLTDALRRAGMMSFNVQGTLDTNTALSIDPQFEDQPEGDVFLQAKTLSIPTVSIPIPNMGPIQTPSLQLGRVELKGRMAEGKIQVDNFTFGQGKDSLTGRIRGELGLQIKKEDTRAQVIPGAFDLKIELNISKSLMDAMSKTGVALALLMVEKYKTTSGETLKYAFRVRAPSFNSQPVFEPLAP